MIKAIETILHLAKILLAILPFVALCFWNHKANLEKPDRSKQYLMPVIAVVYAVVAMLLMNSINTWLLEFIYAIPEWIKDLAGVSWMPDVVANILEKISEFIMNLFSKVLNLNYWIFFISNTVIMFVYILVKKIVTKIMSKTVKMDGAAHTSIASVFYNFIPEKTKWCLKENYVQVRSMFKIFYFGAVVISALLTWASPKLYYAGFLRQMFYPVFGIIILGELYFYLDGLTEREYSGEILGEDEDAYKTVNYSLLRKFLRSVFGDKLLAENTSMNNPLAYDVTTDDIIRELEENEDPKIVNFASFVDILNRGGMQVDHNFLYSTIEMLNGNSILFNNPFYNDLIPYAFYPMNRVLLSHRKVLVVLGRHSIEDDIKDWLERGIESVTNVPYMWNIGVLGPEAQEDLDIGIITRSDVLDIELHNMNSQFLEDVGFMVIIEPSKLISTAQIGLNMLVKKCRENEDNDIVFCMCDKNCDGLVDAMSHILMTSITSVSATKKHLGTSSYMCWSADDEYLHHRLVPNISRYLGMGTELAFAALKNQVSVTNWFGGEAFPVSDIRWIDKQYYYDLTKYANIPTNQESMDEHFVTSSNYWSAEISKHNYFIVEDESFNMFEILRGFATRSTEQGFINVISSDYLLKDYMADNASIFEADPKAIPYIVSDFTRSNRNTILRLVLMLSTYPVTKELLENEFSLLGTEVFDVKKQLWYELYCCYSTAAQLTLLPEDYKDAVNVVYPQEIVVGDDKWKNDIIKVEECFSLKTGNNEITYHISDRSFIKQCVAELRSAGYVAEDEKGHRNYLGAELKGQIYQKYLPGQFFVFGGKYYEMLYLTADGQVLVRRAADHINSRISYRQIRNYTFHGMRASDRIGASRNVAGMKVVKEFADISVKTPGYYSMDRYNDFATARKVSFEGDRNGIPERVYRNKEILRIELPDFDGKLNDNIRYTITLLFNEIFKTVFAENQAYICALTDISFMEETDDLKPMTYSLRADGCELVPNAIYIVEDSQLDLGLTVSVERHLQRLFSIIHDYIDWHLEALEESLVPEPEPEPQILFNDPVKKPGGDEDEEKNPFKRFIKKIRGIGKKKPEEEDPNFLPGYDLLGEDDIPTDDNLPTDEIPDEEITEDEFPDDNLDEEIPEDDISDEEIPEGEDTPEDEIPEGEDAPEDGVTEGDEPEEEPAAEEEKPEEKPEKKGIISKIGDFFKGLFGRKKKPEPETEEIPESADETPDEELPEEAGDGADTEDFGGDEPAEDDFDVPSEDGFDGESTDDFGDEPFDDTGDEDFSDDKEGFGEETSKLQESPVALEEETDSKTRDTNEEPAIGFERKPYHERYYLLFGNEGEYPFVDIVGTLDYLSAMGLKRNPLKQARDGKEIAKLVETTFKPGRPDARYCDFCGAEIYGVEYETLADGRDRCLNCSRTAIKTAGEFRKIFEDVKRNMEAFYGIKINVGIKVEMVNSKTLHKRLGKAFISTPDSDGRVLGVAIKDRHGYSLLVENGSPRMASMLTMAHELTHIWQYINWNDKQIKKKYGKELNLEVYEGMAKWAEIQYAYLINEPATAKREEIITSLRDDEYGHGFLRYRANYPFSLGTVITKRTPFMNINEPLEAEYCGPVRLKNPEEDIPTGDIPEKTPIIPTEPVKGPIERDPGKVNMYAYNLLDEEEKKAYDEILQAANSFITTIDPLEATVTDDQVNKIIDHIRRDHPEIFWFNTAQYYFDTNTRIVSKVVLTLCLSEEEARARQEEIDRAIAPFMSSVTDSMSDYEATLRIYENIIKLVDYDTIGLERQKRTERAPDEPDDLRSIYGVFVNKKAVCAGYAKAIQYLLNRLGIECLYVTSETHAWNVVKLEGDYYHMDVTWGDHSDTKAEKSTSDAVDYDCFCITTEEVLRLDMHEPEAIYPPPVCSATKCNYYVRTGRYFDKFDYDRFRDVFCETVKRGELEIGFKFGSKAVYTEAVKALIDSGRFREAIQWTNLKRDIRLDTSYMYSCRDERYTIVFTVKKI